MLEKIFYNLPYDQVINCRLVCKQWKEVSDNEFLWKERCRREGFLSQDETRTPENWRMYYILCKNVCKNPRNLLKNPRADEGLRFWKTGGARWVIRACIPQHPNRKVRRNFETSLGECLKIQVIDLQSEGYSASFMDQYQPPIKISDWYASCTHCFYKIQVQLLNEHQQCVQEFETEEEKFSILGQNINKWHRVTHTFRNYGPGVRYVKFEHGGKAYGIGIYGAWMTDSSVEVCPHEK